MGSLPENLTGVIFFIFMLGIRHGLDADHLATIDGLTRYNAKQHPVLARYCGSLFSLGHGSAVLFASLWATVHLKTWKIPPWTEDIGLWISTFFLLFLSILNFLAIMRTPSTQAVSFIGIKGRWLKPFINISHPILIVLIGTFFAFSFDTLALVVLISASAQQQGGLMLTVIFGAVFIGGMLLTDGINGLWISHLLSRADQAARSASRFMGLLVCSIGFLTALWGMTRYFSPSIDNWGEGKEIFFGGLIVLLLALGYSLTKYLRHRGNRYLSS